MSVEDSRCPRCAGRIESYWAVCGWCGQRLTSQPASPAPANASVPVELPGATVLLGRYHVASVLGRGGFGITYRAADTRLGRDVAIKELFPPGAQRQGHSVVAGDGDAAAFEAARQRFQREAAALARFSHAGIVRIFEVFEANGTAYLVMELIEGTSVGALLAQRGRPFEVVQVLDLVSRVGDALATVHGAGLLHRDINPSNLMIDGNRRIVLIDFGLARSFGDEVSGQVTRAVTPGYAPPEQYAGSTASGPPSDVFGLAATAYKLLTGATPTSVFDRQAGASLLAPADLRPGIPAMVSAALLDGMELDPAHRPATAAAFLNRLGLFGHTPGPQVLLVSPDADPGVMGGPDEYQPVPVPVPDRVPAPDPMSPPVELAPAHVPVPVPAPVPAVGPAPRPASSDARPAPWAHEPPVVGPPPRWRGWVTWPAAIGAVALGSAVPFVVSTLLVVVALPWLATLGDLEAHAYRQRSGTSGRWWHGTGPRVVAPVRFARNLLVALLRAVPAVAIASIGAAVERALGEATTGGAARALTIRLTGVAMVLVLLVPARPGGRGFRTDLGITAFAGRIMEHRARPGTRTLVVWVLGVAAAALAALLDPELWPFS